MTNSSFGELEERLRLDLKAALDGVSAADRARLMGYFNDLARLTVNLQMGDDGAEREMAHVKAQIAAEMGIQAQKAEVLFLRYLTDVVDLGFAALRRLLG